MTPAEILRRRLENQALARTSFRTAEEVVAWFGAVQAQDYLGSLWALGQRMRGATEAVVEAAESRRAIVRTWPMRGTLHFVAAADVRWMTQLLAPRVLARNAARIKREVGVDAAVVARCREVLARERSKAAGGSSAARSTRRSRPGGSAPATRAACTSSAGLRWRARSVSPAAAASSTPSRCSTTGSRDRHPWHAMPRWPSLPRATSPVMARRAWPDFTWWAGITAEDAHVAADAARPRLASEVIGQREYYWSARSRKRLHGAATPRVKLLPAFDEYTVAYEDRSLLLADAKKVDSMGLLSSVVVADGIVIGTWKRSLARDGVQITAKLSRPLRLAEGEALAESARMLGRFLGLPARLDISAPRAPRSRIAAARPAPRRGAQ